MGDVGQGESGTPTSADAGAGAAVGPRETGFRVRNLFGNVTEGPRETDITRRRPPTERGCGSA